MLCCPMCNSEIKIIRHRKMRCKICGEKLLASDLTKSTEALNTEYLAIVGSGFVKTKPVKAPSFRKTCDAKTERPGAFGLGGFIKRIDQ